MRRYSQTNMRFTVFFIVLSAILISEYGSSTLAATTGRGTPQLAVSTQQNTKGKAKNVVMNPAFANAGKRPGVEVWRIENFNPVAYPANDYGKFYTGDSYIVLFTKESGGVKSYDLHFWLGTETSQDESGAAAVLTVQLDDQLGGVPVQHREVQEHESQLFLSHFKNGVRYLPGGVASGFHHVDNTAQKKLFQVKGKKNIRVKQVEVSAASMNQGDCFILDNGNDIYVYVGTKSKRVERLKAISAANLIRDQDHGGRSKVHVIDEFSSEDEVSKFFEVLGSGSPSQVPEEAIGGDDEQFEKKEESVVSLYKVSDANGKMEIQKIAQKPLKQEMLDTNDCFIMDTELSHIFVWIGKKCNAKEKSESMNKAQNFIKTKKYPAWTKVQRIIEGGEPSIFRQYFQTWRGTGELHTRLIRSATSGASKSTEHIHSYHCKLLSNGKLTVQPIHDIEQEDLDSDDVIIINAGSDIFVWYGKDSDDEERKLSSRKAEIIKERGDADDIIFVNQFNEPEQFTELFPNWDADFWNTVPSYEQRKNTILTF